MGRAGVSFLTLLVICVNFNEIVIVIVNYLNVNRHASVRVYHV